MQQINFKLDRLLALPDRHSDQALHDLHNKVQEAMVSTLALEETQGGMEILYADVQAIRTELHGLENRLAEESKQRQELSDQVQELARAVGEQEQSS